MGEEKPEVKSQKRSKLPLYLSIVLVVAIIICYFTVPAFKEFLIEAWQVLTSDDEERIKSWVSSLGWYGPAVLVLAMILQMFLLVIPTVLLMIVSILAYGPIWGSVIILISIISASSVGYFIAKYLGTAAVIRLLGKKNIERIDGFLKNYGFWAIAVTRLNPFLSNDAISFIAGLLKMNYWKFIGATVLGIAPLTLFIAIMGKNINSLQTGLLWGSLVSLLLLGLYIWWDKKRKSKA